MVLRAILRPERVQKRAYAEVVPTRLRTLQGQARVTSVAFSPDGGRVLSGVSRNIELWDAATGQLLRTFEDSSGVTSVAISPDGARALSGSDDKTRAGSPLATGELLASMIATAMVNGLCDHPAAFFGASGNGAEDGEHRSIACRG